MEKKNQSSKQTQCFQKQEVEGRERGNMPSDPQMEKEKNMKI